MGMYLRRMYGPRLLVCGLFFDRGSFQALGHAGIQEFTVGPSLPDSLDYALAATGLPLFAVDLRDAPGTGVVADWLDSPHRTRTIGAMYNESFPESFYIDVPPHGFDVMFFVAQTNAPRKTVKPMEIEFLHGH
jgi:erythromycin esterase